MPSLLDGGMKTFLSRYSDIALAALVVGMVGMMIIPLPEIVLDLLLTLNITIAVTLLMVSLYIPRALNISAFPSILLITTLFRLALNVSSTRLILLHADAGEVIASFGNFVVQGNFVVGAVIFLILTIIQFLVIAKGSERVSEVAARFTLDAMPGKQMSIDADLRAGAFDLDEARRRRALVQRESQLFGAMDGAMKFVKGDAIAGIIITAINIVAGMVIGVVQLGMPAAEAATTYTLLTIGDGLVSQIPALLIATTSGIIVTRVAGDPGEDDAHLGSDIFSQLLAEPRAIAIASLLLVGLALIPGLPAFPFLLMSGATGVVAFGLTRSQIAAAGALSAAEAEEVREVEAEAKTSARQARAMIPAVTPLCVDIGTRLTRDIGERDAWLREMIPSMREGIFFELGVKVPGLRVRTDSRACGDREFLISIDEIPVDRGEMPSGQLLVNETPAGLEIFRVQAAAAKHPITGAPAAWISVDDRATVEEAGYTTWDAAAYVLLRITATLKAHAHDFVGIQEVQTMLDQLEGPYPADVQEVVPKLLGLQDLTEILRRLVEEEISIRNLRKILQLLADRAKSTRDPVRLTEEVREGMSRYITHRYSGGDGSLVVYLVDREIEEMVAGAIRSSEEGSFLALPPEVTREILDAIGQQVGRDIDAGRRPILLTDARVRRYLKKLSALEVPRAVVLAFQELDPALKIQPIGRIRVGR